jgi:TonB family protein
MLRLGRLVAIASFAFVALTHTNAQDTGNGAAADFEAAQPLSRPPPEYPWSSLAGGKEGWVLLSYVISPIGEVTEPMIEDSSGREDLERSALESVTAWRYSPAMQNGQPVEQSMTKIRIVFQVDGGNAPGARSSFRDKYRRVVDLIAAGDFAKAAPLIDETSSWRQHRRCTCSSFVSAIRRRSSVFTNASDLRSLPRNRSILSLYWLRQLRAGNKSNRRPKLTLQSCF